MDGELLSGRTRLFRLTKLAKGPFDLRHKVGAPLAIPAQMRLVKGRTVERRCQIAARRISVVRLSFGQLFAQNGDPAAKRTQKASPQARFLEHQPQHLLRLARVFDLLHHRRQHCVFQRGQRVTALRRFGKPSRYPLATVLHAEGKQIFLAAKITKKCTPGDPCTAADLLHRSPVEADRTKQFPRGVFDLPQDKLMFPLAKRTGILCFRPFFAIVRKNRFLHRMQIMAQSASL